MDTPKQNLPPFQENWNIQNTPAPTSTLTAAEAAEQVLTLRELTKTTGVITSRSQRHILRSLPDSVLLETALILKGRL